MKIIRLVTLFAITGAFLLVFLLLLPHKSSSISLIPTKPFNYSIEKMKWKTYMQQVGGKKAYSDFITIYKPLPYSLRHSGMHMIGALLFEFYDIQGITLCDATFSYGCYHGFFWQAITKNGFKKLRQMDEMCIKQFGIKNSGCQHGIGHGILSYLGSEKLLESLKICDQFKSTSGIDGCRGGTFMEYNLNKLSQSEKFAPRQLDGSPFSPCNILPDKYQYSCYYSQPEWWGYIFKQDYKEIGNLCNSLEVSKQKFCFLGTGIAAAQSSYYEIDQTITKCDLMPTENGNMLCRAGALWTYRGTNQKTKDRDILCLSLKMPLQKNCLDVPLVRR